MLLRNLSRWFSNHSHKKLPLRLLLVVPFMLQISVAVGLTGWFSIRNGQKAINELAEQLQSEVSNRISQHLNVYLATPHQINQINLDAVELGLLNLSDFKSVAQYFWQQMNVFDVGYISFGNEQGEFIGVERLDNGQLLINEVSNKVEPGKLYIYNTDERGNRTKLIGIKEWDPRSEDWYFQPVKTGKAMWSSVYQWEDKPEILSISSSYPVYDKKNNKIIGVLSIDHILSQISDFLDSLKVSKSGKVFILERNGFLVASSRKDRSFSMINGQAQRVKALESSNPIIRLTTDDLLKRFDNLNQIKERKQIAFTKSDGTHQFVQVTPFQDKFGLDWLIVVVVPESDFTEQINANTRITILLSLGAIGLATGLGILTSGWITKPILRLSAASRELAEKAISPDFGNKPLEGEVEVNGIAEVDVLAAAFNLMARQLHTSFSTLARANEQLEERVEQRTVALHLSEEKFALAFRASPHPIIISTMGDGLFLEVNESFLSLTGYDLEEIVGRTALDLNLWVNPEDREAMFQLLERERKIRSQEFDFRIKSGEIRTGLLSAEIIKLDEEDCLLAVVNDITERKRIQDVQHEREKRIRNQNTVLLELSKNNIPNAVDWQTALREITEAAVNTIDIERASIWLYNERDSALECIDLFSRSQGTHHKGNKLSPDDYRAYFKALEEARTIATYDAYNDLRTRELRKSYSEGSGLTSVLDAAIRLGGKTVGAICLDRVGEVRYWTLEERNFVGSLADLVALALEARDRQRAEEALKNKEQYLRLVLDNIPQQVFWKDTDLVFLGCNKNWANYAQIESPEAVVGLTDYDLINNRDVADSFRDQDRKIMESNTPQLHVIATKQKPSANGETIWLDISKIPLQDSSGNAIGIIGVLEDITQRKNAEEALLFEREKSERLLLNILPEVIAQQLKQNQNKLGKPNGEALIAEQFDDVTILFADIVGFTPLSSRMSPTELVHLLNQIISRFDQLSEKYGLEKIKTIGDAYMVAGGLPMPMANHAEAIAEIALDMQSCITQFQTDKGEPFQIRIGINTGAVVAGVIGTKKFIYDLWGDTVNVASRMESQGLPGGIQVTEATYQRLKDKYILEKRGAISVKGKGEMIAYWLTGRGNSPADAL